VGFFTDSPLSPRPYWLDDLPYSEAGQAKPKLLKAARDKFQRRILGVSWKNKVWNEEVREKTSLLHYQSISRWPTRFLYSSRLLAWSETLLKKRCSCERSLRMFGAIILVIYQRVVARQPEQQQSTSFDCQGECPCRQHVQRVSGVDDE